MSFSVQVDLRLVLSHILARFHTHECVVVGFNDYNYDE